MSISKYIGTVPGIICGDMMCSKCKSKIKKGNYLIVEHYVSKRGNEDDYNVLFHEECSKDDNKWKKYYADRKKEEEDNKKMLEEDKLKAIELIKNAVYIEFGCDEDGNSIIIYL
jgi:hypothetical protein